MAAFAPIPIARVKAAITANPGLRCKTRQPYWTSCQNVSMPTPFLPVAKRGYSSLLITRCPLTFSLTYLVVLIAQNWPTGKQAAGDARGAGKANSATAIGTNATPAKVG